MFYRLKIGLIEQYTQGYYIPKVEIRDYNFTIDGRNFFGQPIKNDLKTYDNIRKIATVQGDDYTTGCILDFIYFKEHYNVIAIDLSKQQKLDTDPKAIQQMNFSQNLEKNATIFFIIKELKETVLGFWKETVKKYYDFISF